MKFWSYGSEPCEALGCHCDENYQKTKSESGLVYHCLCVRLPINTGVHFKKDGFVSWQLHFLKINNNTLIILSKMEEVVQVQGAAKKGHPSPPPSECRRQMTK